MKHVEPIFQTCPPDVASLWGWMGSNSCFRPVLESCFPFKGQSIMLAVWLTDRQTDRHGGRKWDTEQPGLHFFLPLLLSVMLFITLIPLTLSSLTIIDCLFLKPLAVTLPRSLCELLAPSRGQTSSSAHTHTHSRRQLWSLWQIRGRFPSVLVHAYTRTSTHSQPINLHNWMRKRSISV